MAATILAHKVRRIPNGTMVTGSAQFTGTDITATLQTFGLKVIEAMFIQGVSADDACFVDMTVTNGVMPVPSTGLATIGRSDAGPTDSMVFTFQMIGY